MMSEEKSSGVAAILSVIWPGLGQIYNGEIGLGILFIVLQALFVGLSLLLIGIPFALILWIYALYRAYNVAKETHE